jgi:uncharacterized protein (UPF0261 family)
MSTDDIFGISMSTTASQPISSRSTAALAVAGTLDTKAAEVEFLVAAATARGLATTTIDLAPAQWVPVNDQDSRADVMAAAADRIADDLLRRHRDGTLAGLVAVGGATGAALIAPALKRLPLGLPKVLVSAIAAGDTAPYVETTDTVLVAPIVDFVGRSAYGDVALERAAAIAAALIAEGTPYPDARATHIAVSAFGVTSSLVERLGSELEADGIQLAVFSANGSGGRGFERFIGERRVFGAFDITTSEIADEVCGGMLSAGSGRLTAAAASGVPQAVLPGGVDFLNFGSVATVPDRYAQRARIEHTSTVTLVRTSAEDNRRIARTMAQRLNGAKAPATFVVPLKGFSAVSAPDAPFWDPEADAAFLDELTDVFDGEIRTVDAPINSAEVAAELVRISDGWEQTP